MGASAAVLLDRWQDHVGSAGLSDSGWRTVRKIIANYGPPHGFYHGRNHVAFLLDEVDRQSELIDDMGRLRFAA